VDLSVAEAASRLNVDRSRVEQLLRAGRLCGRRSGRIWLVDADALADWAAHARAPGRPMAPARAWALLDILDGGSAPWLSAVARSQVRSRLRDLQGAEANEWRALLRSRSDVLPVRLHPSALHRVRSDRSSALLAGAERAAAAGADLVALDPVAEIYVRPEEWPGLGKRWHAQRVSAGGNLLVHLPRGVWPFAGRGQVGAAALAADLLDSPEPRAANAGLQLLRGRVRVVV
jgi:excisionase family DNA binding protein